MKIFGIGLNKTGTTSLGECLKQFGFRHKSFDLELLKAVKKQQWSYIYTIIAQYDSFEDWPYPLIYEQLDYMFPNSKFILTLRKDTESWLNSLLSHSMRTHPVEGITTRLMAYGWSYPHLNIDAHKTFYTAHNEKVREYFNHRKDDLLEVCWETGSGWSDLEKFLDIPCRTREKPPFLNQALSGSTTYYRDNQYELLKRKILRQP